MFVPKIFALKKHYCTPMLYNENSNNCKTLFQEKQQ